MPVRELILDAYAGLSHKRGLSRRADRLAAAPTWVGPDHARRLAAYRLLDAYYRNVARHFLASDDDGTVDAHREYGDAALLVKVVVAAVLGDRVGFEVAGAEDDPAVAERQAWLDRWLDLERFQAKMLETERDSVRLGDGVYALTWSTAKRRARVRLYDPGFYFPVLDPNAAEDDFPRRVHIAWEFERDVYASSGGYETRRFVRRLTWSLGPIRPILDEDRIPLLDGDGQLVLADGDRFDPDSGRIVRDLPWNDEPTFETCFFTDATWELSTLGSRRVDDFDAERALYARNEDGDVVRDLDLGLDFLPVVHVPNTVSVKDHFGEALLTAVAQILDDLAAADTDASAAASIAGVPMLGVSGAPVEKVRVRPGAVIGLGADGKLTPIDLSASLGALTDYVSGLLDRLSQNARVPAEVLGRVQASEVEAGIIMALSFGPLRSLIGEMRMARAEKYPLIPRFAQRMALLAGELDGDVLPVDVRFGPYLPADRAATIAAVVNLWEARLVSRAAAIRMLVADGVVDGDVAELLEAAEADDFDGALRLLEATDGDLDAVYDLLGRERPEREAEPPVTLPPLDVPGGDA